MQDAYQLITLYEELNEVLQNDKNQSNSASFKKALQASKCVQFFTKNLFQEQENYDPDFKVMGTSKQDLLNHATGVDQLDKQKIIQMVDSQFQYRIQQLIQLFRFEQNQNQDQNQIQSSQKDYYEEFLTYFYGLHVQKQQNMEQLEQCVQRGKFEQCKYVEILQRIFQEIQEIIQNDMQQTKRLQDEEQCQMCMLECEQIQLKLQSLHGNILSAFYSLENQQKLQKINESLDVGLKQAENYKSDLERRLQLYKNQGAEFEEVVKKYEQIRNQRKKQREYQQWLQGLNEELAQEQQQIKLDDEIQDDF